jgi:hypothetical protein
VVEKHESKKLTINFYTWYLQYTNFMLFDILDETDHWSDYSGHIGRHYRCGSCDDAQLIGSDELKR